MPPWRMAAAWNPQKLSANTLTRWAATVLTSQPAQRLSVANWASSSPSTKAAIRRRSSATAAKTNSLLTRMSVECEPRQRVRHVQRAQQAGRGADHERNGVDD